MSIGDVVTAKVTDIQHYGIWLEAEGIRGLLLIPDISNKRVRHPSDYAKLGGTITVKVMRFNPQNGDFVASRKMLHPEEADETTIQS
jgi:small subunit ribosomal protein S1